MAMTTAEHVLVVGGAALAAAVVAPVAVPAALGMIGLGAAAAGLSAATGITLTAGGSALGAGWLAHKWAQATGGASK